jgi:hypothetical protein
VSVFTRYCSTPCAASTRHPVFNFSMNEIMLTSDDVSVFDLGYWNRSDHFSNFQNKQGKKRAKTKSCRTGQRWLAHGGFWREDDSGARCRTHLDQMTRFSARKVLDARSQPSDLPLWGEGDGGPNLCIILTASPHHPPTTRRHGQRG